MNFKWFRKIRITTSQAWRIFGIPIPRTHYGEDYERIKASQSMADEDEAHAVSKFKGRKK